MDEGAVLRGKGRWLLAEMCLGSLRALCCSWPVSLEVAGLQECGIDKL